MAKYKDPNTGVKYSTHTGLKVFTVIVVILLVISIVLNVVLYTQSSDDSVIDSGENGEGGDDGEVNGESSDDDTSLEPGEGIVDTETVIENENAVLTSEFDEYGAATCIYYYPDEHWEGDTWYSGCSYCEGPCEGHKGWITKSGAVYLSDSGWNISEDEYELSCGPQVKTQVLTAEDGSTDINSKVRVSLVFKRYFCTDVFIIDEDTGEYVEIPYDSHVKYTDYYYDGSPKYIEVSSLTDEPLEIERVEMTQYAYFENTSSNMFSIEYTEFRSENGMECNINVSGGIPCPDVTTVYSCDSAVLGKVGGEYLFTLTLSDGNSYSFRYWCIPYPDLMLGAEVVYID